MKLYDLITVEKEEKINAFLKGENKQKIQIIKRKNILSVVFSLIYSSVYASLTTTGVYFRSNRRTIKWPLAMSWK